MTHRTLLAASLVLAVACDDPDTEVNADAIAVNTQTAATNRADLDAALATIAELQAELETVQLAVGDTTAVEALQADVAANTAAVADAVDRLESIEADYLTSADRDALDAALATLTGTVDANSSQVATNTTAIATNTTAVSDNAAAIAAAETDLASAQAAIAANAADLTTAEAAIADNAADIADNADGVATNTDAVDELQTDLTALETEFGDFEDDYTSGIIDTDTTWIIGSSASADYSTVQAAWDDARVAHIQPGAELTLQIENGNYSFDEAWILDHPDGQRLRIEGNRSNPAAVVLRFPGNTDGDPTNGIQIDHGFRVAEIAGVTLQGTGTGGCGLRAYYGGAVWLDAVVSEDFSHGLCAYWNAEVYRSGDEGVTLTGNSSRGLLAGWGAHVALTDSTFEDNGSRGIELEYGAIGLFDRATVADNGDDGIIVEYFANLRANSATIEDNADEAFGVFWNSFGELRSATISGATDNGIYVARDASARVDGTSVSNSSDWGIVQEWDSHIYANTANLQRNGYGVLSQFGGTVEFRGSARSQNSTKGNGLQVGHHSYIRRDGSTISGNRTNFSPSSRNSYGNVEGYWY